MSQIVLNNVRSGFYADSVSLMRLSRAIAERPGIVEAALMMGTPANKEIMSGAGLLNEIGIAAASNDLIIAVKADAGDAAQAALDEAAAQLSKARGASEGELDAIPSTRTLRAALRSLPNASLALVSVPGEFAIAEARKA